MVISWTEDLNTGIDVIDAQHQRIVQYINQLETMHKNDRHEIQHVIDNCADYTVSHFAFEESLQDEAGYAYAKPHKKVHELFLRKIEEYQSRFKQGEDISEELHDLLCRWLINHIKRDDADYVDAVKKNMLQVVKKQASSPEKHRSWLSRFFRPDHH